MNKNEISTKSDQQQVVEDVPIQFKILLGVIVIGLLVWVLQFAGIFG